MPRKIKGFGAESSALGNARKTRKRRKLDVNIPSRRTLEVYNPSRLDNFRPETVRSVDPVNQDLETNGSHAALSTEARQSGNESLGTGAGHSGNESLGTGARLSANESLGELMQLVPSLEQQQQEHQVPFSEEQGREGPLYSGDEGNANPERAEIREPSDGEANEGMLELDHWQKLLPILLVNGSVKLTRNQYDCLVMLCNFFNTNTVSHWKEKSREGDAPSDLVKPVFPSFRTLQRGSGKLSLWKLTVRARDFLQSLDITKAGVKLPLISSTATSDQSAFDKIAVRIVPVSEYARADIACPVLFQEMMRTTSSHFSNNLAETSTRGSMMSLIESPERAGCTSCDCIDHWPLIADREGFYGDPAHVGVDDPRDDSAATNLAEVGDTVLLDPMNSGPLHEELKLNFGTGCTGQSGADVISGGTGLIGTVAAIWGASAKDQINSSRSQASDLCPLEIQIMETFRLDRDMNCFSSVLWRGGDRFTLLRSTIGLKPHAWMLVVHRFIRDIDGSDSSCFFVWIRRMLSAEMGSGSFSYCSTVCSAPDSPAWVSQSICSSDLHSLETSRRKFMPIKTLSVLRLHQNVRGAARIEPVSSSGFMPNGDRYFVYRFMLFWDGFRLTEGKAASGTGVYMVSLNLPRRCRGGAAAVRVLSLIPPGGNVREIFSRLTEDISKGMTEGIDDYDANGNPVKIFLDFVCSCGDTLALNEVTDVLGHQAESCCHLCKFCRRPVDTVKIGKEDFIRTSRYTSTDVHSGKEFARRDMARHEAVNSSGLSDERRRRLGFKSRGQEGICGLHDLSKNFASIRDRIPKNADGRPVISSILDPYRSLIIGPDHLLTGHAKDCINAALQLLSPACRINYEIFAISGMKESGLATQNRLVDRKTGRLFAMSLSEIYTLLFVSEFAFCKAINLSSWQSRESNGSSSEIRGRIRENVRIIGEFSRLVSDLCYWPIESVDGQDAFKEFNRGLGQVWIYEIQKRVKHYLRSLEMLCTIDADAPRRLREINRANLTRTEREKEKRRILRDAKEANIVRTELDHPNVHRLLEMSQTLLPMVGHITRVSELVFEKAHQALKRAIKQSNHCNPHLAAMNAVIFNDWQGRLTMCHKGLKSANSEERRKAELAVFRLLRGREEIFARKGTLSVEDLELVENSIGPSGTVDRLLDIEDRKVLVVDRVDNDSEVFWEVSNGRSMNGEIPCCFAYQELQTTESSPTSLENGQGESNFDFRMVFSEYKRNVTSLLDRLYGESSYKVGNIANLVCGNGKLKNTHRLRTGFVFQALTQSDNPGANTKFRTLASNVDGSERREEITYWFALIFFQAETGCGAVALPCARCETGNVSDGIELYNNDNVHSNLGLYRIFHPTDRIPCVLKLDESCRTAAVLHNCSYRCSKVPQNAFIQHEAHIMNTSFYIIDRRNGYPPRRV